MENKSVIALIPARGGSKGIPRKNIKMLLNKPLIVYAIEAAFGAHSISRVIVSTDDEEIANIARQSGADVPFIRPAKLAEDSVTDYPVIEHCLAYLSQVDELTDMVVYLRPTQPLRLPEEIDVAVQMLRDRPDADCVRSVRPAPYSPYWMKKINSDGSLAMFDKNCLPYSSKPRQDHPLVVIGDGHVDVARVSSILRDQKFPPGRQLAYFRENTRYVDIDTLGDWEYCEYCLSIDKARE